MEFEYRIVVGGEVREEKGVVRRIVESVEGKLCRGLIYFE